jgi:hypothetical protein
MTALADLSEQERLELARDLRAAEAKERERQRQSVLREREAHRLTMRIVNLDRRRERIANELAMRDKQCAPYEAQLVEAEPSKDDRFAHDRWTQAVGNARENLAVHERRRGYLRRVIGEIDAELSELPSKIDGDELATLQRKIEQRRLDTTIVYE